MESIKPSLVTVCIQTIDWLKLFIASFFHKLMAKKIDFSLYQEVEKQLYDLKINFLQEQHDHQQSVTTFHKKLNLLQCSYDEKANELHLAKRETKKLIEENTKLREEVTSFSIKEIHTLGELKSKWLSMVIKAIDEESFAGCGSYYEIYEDRKQQALSHFLSIHANLLSDEELKQFKADSDYDDNAQTYSEYDPDLNRNISIYEMVQREME